MSVKMSKELGLEAYNRDRGGAQHEKVMLKLKDCIMDAKEGKLFRDGYFLKKKKLVLSFVEIEWNHTLPFHLRSICC